MMRWRFIPGLFLVVSWLLAGAGIAQSPHVLNDFESSDEGWAVWYGSFSSPWVENGKLMWESDGTQGAIRDSYNNTNAVFQPGAGGIDLTGLSALEFVNMVYTGDAPTIKVEFYVKASVNDTFKGSADLIGHDVTFTAGIPQTVTVPLENLTPTEIAWIRIYGVTIRTATSTAIWSLDEVRSIGTPLQERYFARFSPESPDGGFQSVFVNFGGNAIQGYDGVVNYDGFSIVPDAGVDGALQFVSIGGATNPDNGSPIGGAIAICNGAGNIGSGNGTYYSQPTDISNYQYMEWLMKAEGVEGASTAIQLYVQTTSGWSIYNTLGGSPFILEADGQWHKLTGDLTSVESPDWVFTNGINIYGHPTDLTIQIDHVRGHNDQPTDIRNWVLY